MKQYRFIYFLLLIILLTSCMEDYNERYFIKEHFVEFEEATLGNKAIGKDYVISRQILSPKSQQITLQVNLVGAQFNSLQKLRYRIDSLETTAVLDKDFRIEYFGELYFEANSSIAFIEIKALPTGKGQTLLVLELEGNEIILSSENYKKLALRCSYP